MNPKLILSKKLLEHLLEELNDLEAEAVELDTASFLESINMFNFNEGYGDEIDGGLN